MYVIEVKLGDKKAYELLVEKTRETVNKAIADCMFVELRDRTINNVESLERGSWWEPDHDGQGATGYYTVNKVNYENPIFDILTECRNQLEYLDSKFQGTGTTANVLSRLNTMIDKLKRK